MAAASAVHAGGRQSPGHMPLPRVGDLEVAQNLELQQRGWVIQRVGWAVMALVLAAAAAGLFGGGPLSRAEAQAGALRVEYPRFARREAVTTLKVHLPPAREGEAHLWLERAYLEKLRIARIEPPPARVLAGAQRITYAFAAEGGAAVSIHLQFIDSGALAGTLGSGAAALAVRHFVYP